MSPVIGIFAIVIYSVITLIIGLGVGFDKGTVSTSRGYFLGGGTQTFILFFTTAASCFSTWIFMGAPGAFYSNGVAWIASAVWLILMCFLMGYYSPRFWRLSKDHGHITPADMLDGYYQSKKLRYIVAAAQLAFTIPTLVAQNQGMGLAISSLTGGTIPFWVGALYATFIVGLYVFLGGFRSQAWVDTVQGIAFLLILWITAIFIVIQPEVGGIRGLYAGLEAYNTKLLYWATDNSYWNIKLCIGFMVMQFMGCLLSPMCWQRFYAAKNGRSLTKMFRWMGILYSAGLMLPAMLIGLSGNLFNLEYSAPDQVLTTVVNSIAPFWGIFVTLAVLAAGMSTVSSNLISASSIVSVDFVQNMVRKPSDKLVKVTGKVAVAVLTVISFAFALKSTQGIVQLLNIAFAGYAMVYIPLFGIFHWKRASTPGALCGLVTGIVSTYCFTFVWPSPLGFIGGIWGFVLGFVVFVLVSLVTKPVSEEHRAEYLAPLKNNKVYTHTIIK